MWGVPGGPPYRHVVKLIARSLFFGCLMSQVKGWDGFWLDDFSVSGTFFFGSHLFAHKSLLEPIVEGVERIKTSLVHGGIGWFNYGVNWAYRMPIHARFTF